MQFSPEQTAALKKLADAMNSGPAPAAPMGAMEDEGEPDEAEERIVEDDSEIMFGTDEGEDIEDEGSMGASPMAGDMRDVNANTYNSRRKDEERLKGKTPLVNKSVMSDAVRKAVGRG